MEIHNFNFVVLIWRVFFFLLFFYWLFLFSGSVGNLQHYRHKWHLQIIINVISTLPHQTLQHSACVRDMTDSILIRHPFCYIKCKYHKAKSGWIALYIKGWVLVILLDWAKFPKELCRSGSMYSTHAYTLTLDSVCFTPTPLAHTLDCSAAENVFLISGPSLSFHFFLPFLPTCKHLKTFSPLRYRGDHGHSQILPLTAAEFRWNIYHVVCCWFLFSVLLCF